MIKLFLTIFTIFIGGCQTYQVSSGDIEKSWIGRTTKELKSNKELSRYKKEEEYIDDINKTIVYSYDYKKINNSFDCLNETDPLNQNISKQILPPTCEQNAEVIMTCSYKFYIQNDIITKYEKIGEQCPSSCKVTFKGCS